MEFTELQDLYDHLEVNASDYEYTNDIADLFKKLRDLKYESSQVNEAEIAQGEIDCFNFMPQNGKLKSMFSSTDNNGHPYEYPTISNLSDRELDYIEGRLATTANPVLRARYAHILWESPKKNKKYAEIAVDEYLKLAKIFEEKDKKDPKVPNGFFMVKSIEQAYTLALSIKYRVDDVCNEIIRLVKKSNLESNSAFRVISTLIEYMFDGKAKFPPQCFEGFPEVCLSLGQKLFKKSSFHPAINIFEVAERVDNKLGLKTHDWNRSIAESYEGLMNERNESDPATISFCQDALEYYRKIGDEKKTQELEKKYKNFIGKQHFGTFSQKIDQKELINHCKGIAQKLCTEEPEKIILRLIADKSLLPRRKDMEKRAEELSKKTILTHIMPVSITDKHGHTAENFSTEEEKRYFEILRQYSFEMECNKQILIDHIFIETVKKNKLNIDIVMTYFEKHSWYGKNITKNVPGGTITYNWLNLIAPSLNDYFIQMQIYFSQSAYIPNFVLAMDSLVLKIEGLVRDICVLSNITTFFQKKDHGQSIVREKDINWLLREDLINSLFDEDDLLFFKFVLIEKAGLNLRHNIAHCLIDYTEYNISCMHLLLLVLFRLGRYDFVKSGETVEEKVANIE